MKKRIAVFFFLHLIFAVSVYSQSYEVQGAGTSEANGVYIPSGIINNKTCYKKGEYTLLYKGCVSKWMITSSTGNLYRNSRDTELPPRDGWQKGCAKECKDPVPVIIPVDQSKTKKKTKSKPQP